MTADRSGMDTCLGDSGNDYMVEGDDTVYIGGNQFYVKSDMSCTFRLKEETE